MSLSGVTHSSRDSALNEQMYSFIKKANKQKELLERLTLAFKKFRFFEHFCEVAPRLLILPNRLEICHSCIELTIKTIEISPISALKVSPSLVMELLTQFDQLTDPEDSASSQLLYEHICRLFELLMAHDPQMTTFKELLCQSVAKIFEDGYQSINFVLIFGKILAHMSKVNVT